VVLFGKGFRAGLCVKSRSQIRTIGVEYRSAHLPWVSGVGSRFGGGVLVGKRVQEYREYLHKGHDCAL
jgi:hypothetical protein